MNYVEFSSISTQLTNTSLDGKIPVKRGCSNKHCFCTGKCRDVIGYIEVEDLKKSIKPFTGGSTTKFTEFYD